jgi:hypothetical protein
MKEIKLENLQVGKKYFIHQVKDEDTHAPMSRKYKAVCTNDYSQGGWIEFLFENIKGINTDDINSIGVSVDDERWGIYKFYLCESDEILERVVNSALKMITGDSYFIFY